MKTESGGRVENPKEARTERGGILEAAREITEGDRNKSYGDPGDQLGLAGMLKEIVRDQMIRDVSPGEMEALDMVLTKLSRAVMGKAPGRDTYVDMAAYAAIAGELAARDEADRRRVAGLDYDLRGVDAKARALIEEMDRQDARGTARKLDRWLDGQEAGRAGRPGGRVYDQELSEEAKAAIRRSGPGVSVGVGPLTGRPHNVYEGEQVAQDVADQKRREAERNSSALGRFSPITGEPVAAAVCDDYNDPIDRAESYSQPIANAEGKL